MAKVTLSDIEYDTKDFTKEQTEMLKEIKINARATDNLNYQLYCLNKRSDMIVKELKEMLEIKSCS